MAPVVHRSTGDLLADRRYAYAEAAWNEGDAAAAADLAGQALDLAPDFAPAHALLGRATAALGRTEEARRALERALALEPDDALGAGIDSRNSASSRRRRQSPPLTCVRSSTSTPAASTVTLSRA
jgi:predicted TPR repeat methyltransferase